jgi:transposase
LAKNVFQAHGAAADGSVVFRRKLSRGHLLKFFAEQPPCLVAMEACASAHHWARTIGALGHTVKLIPPAYVKPFVKRQKNDMADAEAIAEAAARPTMRFVAEVRGAAGRGDGVPDPGPAGASAHPDDQRAARASGRVRRGGAHRGAHVGRLAAVVEAKTSGAAGGGDALARMLLAQIAAGRQIERLDKELRQARRHDESQGA